MSMHHTTGRLLRILEELNRDGVLQSVYDIQGGEPLGDALASWVAAGCPGVPRSTERRIMSILMARPSISADAILRTARIANHKGVPLLHSLVQRGLVSAHDPAPGYPKGKLYRLTDAGLRELSNSSKNRESAA